EGSARLRYVTEICAGAELGDADNRATGSASGGLTSNTAVATVTVTEDLFRSKNIIAGRVIADNCGDDPTAASDGIPGVRIYLEDGTFVITDEQGRYHFEGVASGTHVVQLDLATLPSRYEMALCDDDSRGAGTLFSRFVELHGGTLWREDFHARTKTPPSGAVHLRLESQLQTTLVCYRADIQVEQIAVDNMRLSVILPEGSRYVPGSSRRGSQRLSDPQLVGNVLIHRLGNAAPAYAGTLEFDVRLNPAAVESGQLLTRAMMTFNTPERENQRTAMIDTALVLKRRKVRKVQSSMAARPHFGVLSTALTPQDRQMLDRLVEKLTSRRIEHVVCIGHTDNQRIRPGKGHPFADNQELSVARASAVADYLGRRLNIADRQMTIVGKGFDQPLASNATEQGRARNRRVEVKVMAVKVESVETLFAVKTRDMVVSPTHGLFQTVSHTAMDDEPQTPLAQGHDDIDINALSPGLEWLLPAKGDTPRIASIKLAVQHLPEEKITLLLDNRPVSALNFDGTRFNKSRTVAVSHWRGVDLREGDNHFTAVCKDRDGKEIRRIERMVHLAGPAIHVEYLKDKSRLMANGRDAPTVALRLTDKDGHPARFGSFGTYEVLPPYQPYVRKKEIGEDRLTRIDGERQRFTIEDDGRVYIKLEPTTQAGYATVKIPLSNKDHEVCVWLEPELRDWILVGLVEGTAGYNAVSGNLETLKANHQEENYYQDGRIAFFAKGKVKGKWLVTAAYDTGKQIEENDTGLFQTIDPDTYYTLYGDAAQQQNEAPSIRKLYLKIEREQFYALFGDFNTGLSVTELSRYSRSFNGFKSEYAGRRWAMSAFATDTDQAFIKDEIRGDGTSGLYHLSRQNIVPNSETVTIETRDRYRSELIVSSQTLTRHIDYNIDTDAGTLFFKTPVYSRDENFNPTYIVIEYESGDASEQAYTYGGRGSVKLADGKVEIGATYIHEGPTNAEGDLGGLDAHIDFGNGIEAKAEVAATGKDDAGAKVDGQAYLAEVSKHSASHDATVYFRELGEGFGLGQQNSSEEATRKIGADAHWRLDKQWSLSGELYRHYNLTTDAQRDLAEARVAYHQPLYHLYSGLRTAQDQLGDTATSNSTQLLLGGSRRLLDNRLQTRISHEQSVFGNNESADFPTRTTVGADYKVSDPVTLFAEHEVAQTRSEISQGSRMGVKATPWRGSQIGSSVGRAYDENGQRLFANLGLNQKWRINDRWSVQGGLDRTQTVHSDADPSTSSSTTVTTAAGGQEDFTAITLGAGYRADQWSWTGRVESRSADSEDKWGVISGIAGEVRPGLGVSAGVDLFNSTADDQTDSLDAMVRLSLAYRPKNTRWIVLDRLDYNVEKSKDTSGSYEARSIVNNFNANFKPHHKLQAAFQYGAKYVLDTIDNSAYTGYTDLIGLETRYDLTRQWDLGLHASLLHSWSAGQLDYRTGCSVGYAMVKNMWASLGYNFTGFTDEEFSAADHTAAGPFVKLRMKIDQQSVKEMVAWFAPKK
ncbi:MAG: OmpA family protein, partial [Desulfobacteraceae bacterium]